MIRVAARALLAAGLAAGLAVCPALADRTTAAQWSGSWAAAQQVPEPGNALKAEDLTGATLRQIVHLSSGGAWLRVRISNAFGQAPLHLAAVHVARALSPMRPAVAAGSDRTVVFGGSGEVTVPAGAEYWSDTVDLTAAPLSDLAVSLTFDAPPPGQTGHPGSRQVSWIVAGAHAGDSDLPGARRVEHWYELSGVDVLVQSGNRGSVVVIGDSISDGYGVANGSNGRWTDVLAERLQKSGARGRGVGVLNVGIGGNHVLTDGLGPNLAARFDRDVLGQSGVRTVIVFEGVNDLGGLAREAPASSQAHDALVQRLILAYAQLVTRGRAHGLRMIGATVTPFAGSDYYHPDAATEADRQRLNAWIRSLGHFDAVVDFDAVLRDPVRPDRLRPALDSGDHLHPSAAGYRALGEAVPIDLLLR